MSRRWAWLWVLAADGIMIAIVVLLALGIARVHGWDWTIGGSTSYCGVYWPHLDFYCQSGH